MRSLKYVLPLGLALVGSAASWSCNDARLETEYDSDAGIGGPRGGGYDLAGADLRRPRNRDAACASVKAEATLEKGPVDIIFVIDNSGSMTDEIQAVQQNINKNFADIIGKSGLDYRVIMVTSHGDYASRQSVCISAPLSGNPTCTPVPPRPINTARFFHYSIEIESTDSFTRLLNSYNGNEKDQFGLAPAGWSSWLRPDAFKVFIAITDDNSDTTETVFESQLLAKTPKMFGTVAKPNFVWHSIVGLKENSPPSKAWGPGDPLQTQKCSNGGGAVNNGQIYQKLSIATGGLRFPICEHSSFDAVFNNVAMGVIAGAKVACDFPLPMAPPPEKLDPDSVILEYTPMGTGAVQTFRQVKGAAQCAADAFYVQGDRIYICPMACDLIQGDTKAKVDVSFDCLNIIG